MSQHSTSPRSASAIGPSEAGGEPMEFRILGPLEVLDDGGVVPVGGIKPRATLAVLLLHANEAVSAERLALALWGEEAPPTAIKMVHVHVSRLRKALGDPEILVTTTAGYRLRVRPAQLDVERFQRLADDGQRALATGQAERAATALREALAIWRGPALADFAFEAFAQAAIMRLEEQRLSAIEALGEADLAAGRHATLVGELQMLVRAYPARERLAGQLMLALYRCGRQVDALDAYQRARRSLVEAFGVEPGPALLRLHEAILHRDASLDALHTPSGAGATGSRGGQLERGTPTTYRQAFRGRGAAFRLRACPSCRGSDRSGP